MRNALILKALPLVSATLLFAHASIAHADTPAGSTDTTADLGDQTLELNDDSEAKVNGVTYQPEERPVDVYAEVVKVIQGPEGESVMYLRPVEARKTNNDGSVEKLPVSSAEPRPFEPEGDWKMFDAEGEDTDDPRFAVRVIMPYAAGEDDKTVDVIWNECQGAISGNYVGLPCNKRRGLNDDYMAYLKQNYLPCVNQSLKAIGLPPAVSVHLQHDGTTADDQHSRKSLHTVGRAIDVQIVTTTDAKGNKHSFDFRQTNTDHKISHSCKPAGTQLCGYFEAFRACWGKLQVARKCPPRHDGPLGTIGWEDPRHIAHHLHTSYPFCPNNKGMMITEQNR